MVGEHYFICSIFVLVVVANELNDETVSTG